jgi:hypothetical protein
MDKVFLVYDEYRYDGVTMDTMVYACATMEIAIRKVKERLEWYLKNSYLNNYVNSHLNLREDYLDEYDIWEIDEDSVEIFIEGKDTALNLHIAEENIINN